MLKVIELSLIFVMGLVIGVVAVMLWPSQSDVTEKSMPHDLSGPNTSHQLLSTPQTNSSPKNLVQEVNQLKQENLRLRAELEKVTSLQTLNGPELKPREKGDSSNGPSEYKLNFANTGKFETYQSLTKKALEENTNLSLDEIEQILEVRKRHEEKMNQHSTISGLSPVDRLEILYKTQKRFNQEMTDLLGGEAFKKLEVMEIRFRDGLDLPSRTK